jgi:hypothetical protein
MEVHIMTALTTRAARLPVAIGTTLRKTPSSRAAVYLPASMLVVAVVEYAGNSLGLWWLTFLVGVAAGAVRRRGSVGALAAGTLLAWGVGMLLQSAGRTLDIAGVISALALGARGLGWVIVVITLLYAWLLALSGAWLGAAARRLVVAYRAVDGTPQPAATAPAEPEPAAVALPAPEPVVAVPVPAHADPKETEHV